MNPVCWIARNAVLPSVAAVTLLGIDRMHADADVRRMWEAQEYSAKAGDAASE
jgi:hypothetical protein